MSTAGQTTLKPVRAKDQVSAQKLRGGFYTPEPLVRFCLERLSHLLPPGDDLRLVEPSAGDGAFVRGIGGDRHLVERIRELTAIEPFDIEAGKCRKALEGTKLGGAVVADSAVRWAVEADDRFDAAVGNPPFLRYQFISADDRRRIPELGARAGLSFAGVSNLWLAVFVAALCRLKPGGAFSFVVPTELLTGLAASHLRRWTGENFQELRVDLFEPGSFPGVLQEVAVFSGRRAASAISAPTLTVGEHDRDGASRTWTHSVDPEQQNWTRYLLSPTQLGALDTALAHPSTRSLGSLARFQVSIVTGANEFFSVSDEDLRLFDLAPWAKPLLPRIRHAEGLVYTRRDQTATRRSGARSWLLDFSEGSPNPMRRKNPARYLRSGEKRGLHKRYKCRIREPWFRVPHIERGSLLLSKRSHRYPRMIVNQAGAYTTDTIYRGRPAPGAGISARALSAGFHNSLTLLSAELEGRSFGGGVLELVPSEIERLAVPRVPESEDWIERLDAIARSGDEEGLVRETDEALIKAGVLDGDVAAVLGEARLELLARRLARNARGTETAEEAQGLDLAA